MRAQDGGQLRDVLALTATCFTLQVARRSLVAWMLHAAAEDRTVVLEACLRRITRSPGARWGGSDLETKVDHLLRMGFPREQALAALASNYGRVAEAAAALLDGSVTAAATTTKEEEAGRYADPGGRYILLFQTLELASTLGGTLTPVPDEFATHPLFTAFFGDGSAAGMHCRLQSLREKCTRLEIVGHGYEMAMWRTLQKPPLVVSQDSMVIRQTYVLRCVVGMGVGGVANIVCCRYHHNRPDVELRVALCGIRGKPVLAILARNDSAAMVKVNFSISPKRGGPKNFDKLSLAEYACGCGSDNARVRCDRIVCGTTAI